MKKITILFLIFTFPLYGYSQQKINLFGTVDKKFKPQFSSVSFEKGDEITIAELLIEPPSYYYNIISEQLKYRINPIDISRISFHNPQTRNQAWQLSILQSDLHESISTKGYQYGLRHELDQEAIDYLRKLEEYDGFFEDAYLTDYLQSLLYEIHPITLGDKRPGNLNIRVLKSNEPNAFCLPNGTIIVSTGLLSVIESEDELIGVLSHEVAHFVLDHQLVNYNAQLQRQQRAEFWAGFATVVAAASEVYMAAEHDVYTGGSLTMSTAILSTIIANEVIERLGLKYSQNQEMAADHAAKEILKVLGRDSLALSAALTRLVDYNILVGNYVALTGEGSHPGLPKRVKAMGMLDINDLKNYHSTAYQKLTSFVNTFNAIQEYNMKHLETCNTLIDKNIQAGIATEDDYILKGMVLRTLYNTLEKNQEALSYIQKAKLLNVTPRNFTYKQEAITLLRLDKKQEAIAALENYLNGLEDSEEETDFIWNEIEWTRKMIYKTKQL
jgi:predicted Zn-dependent protease